MEFNTHLLHNETAMNGVKPFERQYHFCPLAALPRFAKHAKLFNFQASLWTYPA